MQATAPALILFSLIGCLIVGCVTSSPPQASSQNEVPPRSQPHHNEQEFLMPSPTKEISVRLVEFEESDNPETSLIGPATQIVPPPAEILEWRTGGINANGAESYDLEMLLALASNNNPTLQQANLQISATLAQAQQAGLYPNPNLAYLGENIGTEGSAGEFQGAELEQRFVTANKLELSRNKFLQRAKVAEHLAVVQQFKVCNDVRLHYVNTLAAQSLLALRRELLKTAEDRLVTTKELFNLGQANQVDVHRSTADLRRHQLEVLAAENRLRQAFFDLSSIVGVELSQHPLSGSLVSDWELIDFDLISHRILSESPELLAAHAKLRADHITLHREKVEWVPDIVVSGGPGYNFAARDAVANVRVQIEIPLYDRNQGTIRQAEADQSHQQLEIRRIEMMLRRRLAKEYDRYLTALQKVENYEELILPEMKQAYEQILLSYRDDRQDWPDVLEIYTEYTMRRIEQIQNLQQLRSAQILIDGFLLQDGLEAASNPTPPGHIDSTPKPR